MSDYPGTVEILPGVFLDFDEESPAIYFADKKGEIVTWNYDEIKEDPSGWTASLKAVALAAESGVEEVRRTIEEPQRKLLR